VGTIRIVVVGAGPAGMMAAIRAGQLHQDVILVEKKASPGKKLLLSGKGRCNLTNACELDSFIKRFSKNGQFLRDAFSKFFNLDLMRFFETRDLKLKIERQLRVFPASNKAGSVLGVLKKELYKNKVEILYKSRLKDIFIQDGKVKGLLLADGRRILADKIILATGGLSFSFTGSTAEAISIAKELGHRIVPFRPGLVPLETRQKYPGLLEGLTLKNIRLKFSDNKRQVISDIGELLFTKFGISGPLALSLSGQIVDWLSENKDVHVEVDLKPGLSIEQLNARLLREFKLNSKKTIKNILKNLLPQRLVDVFLDIARIAPDKNASQINQKERQSLVLLLKGWRLNITGSRPIEEAMISRGGVSLRDINPRTLESRLIKGLYFAGEMIDIDADTGGFNLQAAFSTGYLAGESAAVN
jgi:predicted Rossmann fold flavoprotein